MSPAYVPDAEQGEHDRVWSRPQEGGSEAGMRGWSPQHTHFAFKLLFGLFLQMVCRTSRNSYDVGFSPAQLAEPSGALGPTPTGRGTAPHLETALPARHRRGPLPSSSPTV